MKIFVTGATGFVGTVLAKKLSETEHEMVYLIRKSSHTSNLSGENSTLVTGDVTDRQSLIRGMTGCDWVVNLANIYSLWEPEPSIYSRINVNGTRNVMECALETGISKIVHVSTFVVYGMATDYPFTEESKLGPVRYSEYARSKYAGDLIAWKLHKESGLPLVVVYPGAVLGAGDPKATGQYIQNIVKRKMPARVFEKKRMTFVYVGDVAEGIIRALENKDNIGEKYLLGKYSLSYGEVNNLLNEMACVALPRMVLPDFMVIAFSRALTWWADLTKKPPLWGMAKDQIETMRRDCCFDGSKAERDLGIHYTPLDVALEEAISSY